MSSTVYLGILIVLTPVSIIAVILWLIGDKKYQSLLDALPDKEHPLKMLYPLGFEVLDLLRYNYSSRTDKKYIQYCKTFYGEKNGQFYYCINLSQKISIATFVAILGVGVGLLMDSLVIVGFAVLAAVGIAYYYHSLITDIIHAREESIMHDFPDVLSKMALLVNAGMIMREAWAKISTTGDGVLYQEMAMAIENIDNGESEMDAYVGFARRCNVPSVTKFTAALVQNLAKGNKELVQFLRIYMDESWNERKQEAKRKGEAASTKLVIPITLMLLGIMLMIMIPMFSSMSI